MKNQPINLDLEQSNKLLLSIRYKDSIQGCETKGEENVEFSHLCKSMLVRYGSTHSARDNSPRGLWGDQYHREPNKSPNALLDHMFGVVNEQLNLSKNDPDTHVFIPVNNIKVLKEVLGASFNNIFESDENIFIEIAGREIPLVKVKLNADALPKNTIYAAKVTVGRVGQFPNRDLQLWMAALDYENLYSKITCSDSEIVQYYTPSNKSAAEIKNSIKALLSEQKGHPKKISQIKLFQNLIDEIPVCGNSPEANAQIRLTFSRLEYILDNAIINQKEKFWFFLEFAFDELIYLNTLVPKKSDKEIIKNFSDFFKTQYAVNEDYKSVGTFVCLGNSGIDVISQNVSSVIKETQKHKDTVKIYFDRDVYFEINYNLQQLTGDNKLDLEKLIKIPKEVCLTLNEKKSELAQYKHGEICDIIVCEFVTSVSRIEMQHKENRIEELIESQLLSRKKQSSNNNNLIVIIDTTLNSFDDGYVMLLLEKFKKQISSGELAIITAHSLNKYFHIGFDKLPCGVSSSFYNPEFFPVLAKFHENNIFMNYKATDATPQMIATLLKNENYTDNLLNFHNTVKRNSRYVHHFFSREVSEFTKPESPVEVLNSDLLSIYNPYANLFQNWGFFVIKTKVEIDLSLVTQKFRNRRKSRLWIFKYDLFYDPRGDCCISIGTEEDENDLKNKFKILANYIATVNKERQKGNSELDFDLIEGNFSNPLICKYNKLVKTSQQKEENLFEDPITEDFLIAESKHSEKIKKLPSNDHRRISPRPGKLTNVTPTSLSQTPLNFHSAWKNSHKNINEEQKIITPY